MKANKQQEVVQPEPTPVMFETRREIPQENIVVEEKSSSDDKELPSFVKKLFGKRN